MNTTPYLPSGTVYGTLLNFQREHALWTPRMGDLPYQAPPWTTGCWTWKCWCSPCRKTWRKAMPDWGLTQGWKNHRKTAAKPHPMHSPIHRINPSDCT